MSTGGADRPRAYSLQTPRLSIRPYHPDDAETLVDVVSDSIAHLRPWMPFAAETPTVEGYRELFTTFQERLGDGDYTCVIRHDGEVVGGGGLHPSVGELGREIGYWIARAHCGNGFAGEAVAALMHLAFVVERVDRVELRIEPGNHASIRVAERMGCVREAFLRRRVAFPIGPPRDVYIYTMFAAEWPDSPAHVVPVRRFARDGSELG